MTLDELKAPVTKDSYWTYKTKHYKVFLVDPMFLIQYEDEWHPAVIYRNDPEENGLKFCRSQKEFLEKFKRVFKD